MSEIKEGTGPYIDYRDSDNVFTTSDPQEWDKHLRESNATISGTLPCVICTSTMEVKDLPYGTKAVCDNCKKELV